MGKVDSESFIKIEGWMVTELGLSGIDCVLYALIHGFSIKKENGILYPSFFWGSLDTIQAWTNSSRQTVLDSLARLQGIDPEVSKKRKQKRKNAVDYVQVIIKEIVPKGKIHYCMYYTIESRKIIELFNQKMQSENQTIQEQDSLIIRQHQSENQTIDSRNFRLNNTINTNNDKSTTGVFSLTVEIVINAIKKTFMGYIPFDKDISIEITRQLIEYDISENQVEKYIQYVYEKTILKNPNSIANYFYSIVSKSSVVFDFKTRLENQKQNELTAKLKEITCPVCSQIHQEFEDCPCCKLRDINNFDEIEIKKQVQNLPVNMRKEFERELETVENNYDFSDFVNLSNSKKTICKKYFPSIPDEKLHYCW